MVLILVATELGRCQREPGEPLSPLNARARSAGREAPGLTDAQSRAGRAYICEAGDEAGTVLNDPVGEAFVLHLKSARSRSLEL